MSGESGERTAREGRALRALSRLVATLAGAAMALAAASLLASLALIGWSVVMRYVFNDAPVWVDEAVAMALVAIVMLAAAQALRDGEHIAVDLLVGRLGPSARRWAHAWGAVATAAIAIVLIVNGWGTAMLAKTLGLLTEGTLEWPTWLLMLLMPVGGALLLLAAVETLWRTAIGAPLPHDKQGAEAGSPEPDGERR